MSINTSVLVYLDVGAHIGTHALPMLAAGIKVWAVEPQQANQARVGEISCISITAWIKYI